MEKYNEAEILRDIRHCVYDGNYDRAMELADQIDIHKTKNISSLCLLGEVYLEKGKYEAAEEALSKAYDKAPKGRRLLDLLTTLYINKKDYVQAEYYYKEFISVASKDLHRYVLRYRLDKGKGERLSVLIHTLEQLKDYEYIEEWAYELAKLYHEAGEDKKCIRECDEIALWFGQGEYVDKAARLKSEITGEALPSRLQPAPVKTPDAGRTVGATYMFDSEGILANSGLNMALNVEEFMQEEALEKAEQSGTAPESMTESYRATGPETVEATPVSENIVHQETSKVTKPSADLSQKASDPKGAASKQTAVSADTSTDIEWSDGDLSESEDKEMISALFCEIVLQPMEEEGKEQPIKAEEDPEETEADRPDSIVARIQNNMRGRWRGKPAPSMSVPEGADDEDEIISETESGSDLKQFFGGETQEEKEHSAEEVSTDAGETSCADETAEPAFSGEIGEKATKNQRTDGSDEQRHSDEKPLERFEDEDEILTEDIPIPDTVMDIFATAADIKDVKNQLAKTFTKLESSLLEKEDILAPYDINFVVSGNDDSMKSQISIGIAKALNTYGLCDKQKIVGATAEQLNAMDFTPVFEKITGGCLIISGAGKLSKRSIRIIKEYVDHPDQKVAIVLEDSQDNLHALWKANQELRSKFLNVINIAKYDERELVKLAESYAKRKGYDISEEARMVTLREIFEKRMLAGEDVGYEDVMAVVDEAIINLEKRNMKNLFMTVLDNAYKEASMFTLLPEDFV